MKFHLSNIYRKLGEVKKACRLAARFPTATHEILLVDGSSTDGIAEVAASIAARKRGVCGRRR